MSPSSLASRKRPRVRAAACAAAAFGLRLDATPSSQPPDVHHLVPGAIAPPGAIVALVGPSGCGKSTLLRAAAHAARASRRVFHLDPRAPLPNTPCVELLGNDWRRAIRLLAAAGLAEASCFLRKPAQLSEGQRWRVHLARALDAAQRHTGTPALLVIDEFAASLDALTAVSVATLLRRLVHGSESLGLLLATHRAEVLGALAPARTITPGDNAATPREPALALAAIDDPLRVTISPGARAEYDAFARWHYRSGPPRSFMRVLVARAGPDADPRVIAPNAPLGVLVLSRPVLNGSWRDLAWPELFRGLSPRQRARALNHPQHGVCCISRVVTDPRVRGLGVAHRLVRAALESPITSRTEALASMALASGLFERAGMRRIDAPPAQRHTRLLAQLAQAGLHAPDLALPALAWQRWCECVGAAHAERALRTWARASRATARSASAPVPRLWAIACATLASRPVAFVHTHADAPSTAQAASPNHPHTGATT